MLVTPYLSVDFVRSKRGCDFMATCTQKIQLMEKKDSVQVDVDSENIKSLTLGVRATGSTA